MGADAAKYKISGHGCLRLRKTEPQSISIMVFSKLVTAFFIAEMRDMAFTTEFELYGVHCRACLCCEARGLY